VPSFDDHVHVATVGTTAEIRQLRHLTDGSVNVVTKGRQRFRVWKAWTEADGAVHMHHHQFLCNINRRSEREGDRPTVKVACVGNRMLSTWSVSRLASS
jgi:Lon protease-like protein